MPLDRARLHAAREQQARMHGRAYTSTDRKATDYVAAVAEQALDEPPSASAIVRRAAALLTVHVSAFVVEGRRKGTKIGAPAAYDPKGRFPFDA